MKLYATPAQKRLLLELAAEGGVRYFDMEHLTREEAGRKIDYLIAQNRKKEL